MRIRPAGQLLAATEALRRRLLRLPAVFTALRRRRSDPPHHLRQPPLQEAAARQSLSASEAAPRLTGLPRVVLRTMESLRVDALLIIVRKGPWARE